MAEQPAPGRDDEAAGRQQSGPQSQSHGQEGTPAFLPPPPPPGVVPRRDSPLQRAIKKIDPVITRTLVDLDACRQVVSRIVSDKEVQVKEHLKKEGPQPTKPLQPVDAYRKATPCQAEWDGMSGTDQYRLCYRCKLFVYDFTKMDKSDAEHLVFKREGKTKPRFYRRRDGRFLTADCPVGVARGKKTASVVGLIGVIIVAGIGASWLLPHPQPPLEDQPPQEASGQVVDRYTASRTPSDSAKDDRGAAPVEEYLPVPADVPVMVDGAPTSQPTAEVMPRPYLTRPVMPRGGYPRSDD
ncbi:MAG TPA: hypothetical protein V6D08_13650, partial [Candidatus Obscuribacterales bacterium]